MKRIFRITEKAIEKPTLIPSKRILNKNGNSDSKTSKGKFKQKLTKKTQLQEYSRTLSLKTQTLRKKGICPRL